MLVLKHRRLTHPKLVHRLWVKNTGYPKKIRIKHLLLNGKKHPNHPKTGGFYLTQSQTGRRSPRLEQFVGRRWRRTLHASRLGERKVAPKAGCSCCLFSFFFFKYIFGVLLLMVLMLLLMMLLLVVVVFFDVFCRQS